MIVGYDDINPLLRQAIIATEDARFESHFGLNVWRILVVPWSPTSVKQRRAQGASTITQQVARNLDQFGLTKQKLLERKIREEGVRVLAVQVRSRSALRRELFAIYCNQMYLGHGAYGVEAASRLYFAKTNKQLTLEEAALIGGIFQTPERQSPFVDMKRAVARRRNVVLQRMADERYITQAVADDAKQKPIVTRGQPNQPPGIAPFFVEEVRKHLERQYGAKDLYENGLSVTTTLDAEAAGAGVTARSSMASRTVRQAPRLAETHAQRLRREADHRHRARRPLDSSDRRRRRHLRFRRHGAEVGRCAAARRPLSRRPGARRLRVDIQDVSRHALQAGRYHRRRRHEGRRGQPDAHGEAGADTAGGGGADGDRQPHRPDPGDGRRLELLAQQVQPIDSGLPADRIHLQAHRLYGGHRPRLHADVDDQRRAGDISAGGRPGVLAHQLRPHLSRAGHDAVCARRIAQHSGDQDDGHARAEDRARVREAVRVRRELPAVPADCARGGRCDAARGDERVLDVSESGRPHEAVHGDEREGSRR